MPAEGHRRSRAPSINRPGTRSSPGPEETGKRSSTSSDIAWIPRAACAFLVGTETEVTGRYEALLPRQLRTRAGDRRSSIGFLGSIAPGDGSAPPRSCRTSPDSPLDAIREALFVSKAKARETPSKAAGSTGKRESTVRQNRLEPRFGDCPLRLETFPHVHRHHGFGHPRTSRHRPFPRRPEAEGLSLHDAHGLRLHLRPDLRRGGGRRPARRRFDGQRRPGTRHDAARDPRRGDLERRQRRGPGGLRQRARALRRQHQRRQQRERRVRPEAALDAELCAR